MLDVLITVGHSRNSPGAAYMGDPDPSDDIYEYDFNSPLAPNIALVLVALGVDAHYDGYTPGPDVARWNGTSRLLVELHCNAFNTKATGTEVLYARGSTTGERAAQALQSSLTKALGLHDRGVKPISPTDRGGYLIWGVNQTALIAEPFFIDNKDDLTRAQSINMVEPYVEGIMAALETMDNGPRKD